MKSTCYLEIDQKKTQPIKIIILLFCIVNYKRYLFERITSVSDAGKKAIALFKKLDEENRIVLDKKIKTLKF